VLLLFVWPLTDRNVGKYYAGFIYPYKGTLGTSLATSNRFWAVAGNHDVSVGN
jgi:hypothetical protein